MFGFLNLNKPRNLGSRTAINSVVRLVRPHKVGHTGTLDPLARGVLVTAIGPATRLSKFIQEAPKRYHAVFRAGFTSDTEDITGEVESLSGSPQFCVDQLNAVLPGFVGEIEQTPPQFSALKVDGVRAYKVARRGEKAKIKPRTVTIHQLELIRFDYPDFEIEIECGGGTYVRTLGRDIAKALGSDAIMTELTRTAVGSFHLDDAIAPEELTLERLNASLVAPQTALPCFATVEIDDAAVKQLLDAIPWTPTDARAISSVANHEQLLAIDGRQRAIALLQRRADGSGSFTPKLNFAHYWDGEA